MENLSAIQNLTESEIDEAIVIQSAIRGDELKDSFYEFFKEFWEIVSNEPLVTNWHMEKLCEVAQENVLRVIRREPKLYDIPINVPPGSTKSKMFSVMLNCWAWTIAPWLIFITGSHDFNLACDFVKESRRIIKSEKFQAYYPGLITLVPDDDKVSGFTNTEGGRRIACSVGSNITGKHAHILVLDDLINPKVAASEADLKTAMDWLKKTIPSRKIDKKVAVTFLIMQRLHEMDPTGVWLEDEKKGKRLYHICIPGEIRTLNNVKPESWVKYYKNDLMDTKRLSWGDLDDFKIDQGSREYAGQILQNPGAVEGTIFLRKWWQTYRELPMTRKMIYQSWDTALKDKQMNDYSCCTTWYVYNNGYYLVDFWMEKVESPELRTMMVLKASDFHPHRILVEDKGSGTTIMQDLRRTHKLNIFEIQVDKDKVVRAKSAAPTIEAGNVYLPEKAAYTAGIIDRFAMFPDAKHDDDVDSVTQFLNYILINKSGGRMASAKPKYKLRGY